MPLQQAKVALDEALKELEGAHKSWSEAVTALHMSELALRTAQRKMREAYNVVANTLSEHAA